LGSAIEKADGEAILYCLNGIDQWYEENMEKIQENDYVYNQDEHEKTQSLIKNLLGQLSGFDFSSLKASSLPGNVDQTPLIFLSHCSKDKKYGDALEALIMGLGVQPEQLIYTSHPLHKIPLGENIYDYLRKCMNQNIYMIILWSKSYLESPACLNEMGAAWVKQSNSKISPVRDWGIQHRRRSKAGFLLSRKHVGIPKPYSHSFRIED
jgi:hypothetical protein